MIVIELTHPTDPRFLLVDILPPRISIEDVGAWIYGKPLIVKPEAAGASHVIYEQPDGPGTDWVLPQRITDAIQEYTDALSEWANGAVLGEPAATSATIDLVADRFHRNGVPVTRGRIEGDAIVFDIDAPKGVG